MHKCKKYSIKPLTTAICFALSSSLLPCSVNAEIYTLTFGSGVSAVNLNDPKVNDGLFTVLTSDGVIAKDSSGNTSTKNLSLDVNNRGSSL